MSTSYFKTILPVILNGVKDLNYYKCKIRRGAQNDNSLMQGFEIF